MMSPADLPAAAGLPAGGPQLHHLASAFEDAVIGMTLVAPDGTTVKRYAPKTEPEALASDITALLADAPA